MVLVPEALVAARDNRGWICIVAMGSCTLHTTCVLCLLALSASGVRTPEDWVTFCVLTNCALGPAIIQTL
jgi:hypothetical protein